MEKAGLKTFVYSFVFSLFTVFSVNGLYLRAHPSTTELKIPNKNVTLFLKDLAQQSPQAQALPTKKIVLSILPDITKAPDIIIEDKIPLKINDYIEEDNSYQMAESDAIPLEISQNPDFEKEIAQPETNIEATIAPLPEEKIVDNFEEIIQKSPPVDEQQFISPPVEAPQQEIKIASTDFDNEKATILAQQVVIPDIENTANITIDNKADAPQMLIPLQKDKGIIRSGNKTIEIVNNPAVNQVALNSGNIPIKSMVGGGVVKKAEATSDAKASWQPMSDKANANEPWLVAKAKNPQNSLVAESEAYKQDEAEIRQALSGRAQNATNDGEPEIQLAAETVKNLLIPIPDDILKDENLTPQLASSPQNKVIEEKLNVELGEDYFKQEAPESIPTAEAPQSSNSSGILNSLTSIFSGKDTKTPEIGTSIENESGTSNMFSSFTRRKSKSGTKILPTEMRLSFQPNRAEISGQTLRWIRAFANKVNQENTTGLEIRIDGTSAPALQQRRLNLLQNILVGENINYGKVNTVFTSREPNSLIIRTVKINIPKEDIPKNNQQPQNNRYQQW